MAKPQREPIPFFETFYAVYVLVLVSALFLIGVFDGTVAGTLLALYQIPLAFLAFHNNPVLLFFHTPAPSPTPAPYPDNDDDSDNSFFDGNGGR